MSTSKSASSTSSQSSTASYDQRVAADSSGIAVGAGGTYSIQNQFSDNVAAAFSKFLDFSTHTVDAAIGVIGDSQKAIASTATAAVAGSNTIAANAQLGNANIIPQIAPWVVGAVALFVAMSFFKKG